MHVSFCVGNASSFSSENLAMQASVGQLLKKGLGTYIAHAATHLQLSVPRFGSLKLIWVCLHILHSLCFAKIQISQSFTCSEQT